MRFTLRCSQFGLMIVAMLGVACGGAPEGPKSTEIDAEESPIRACALLTEGEWTEVLGTKEAEPSEENLLITSAVPNRFKSSCLLAGERGWAIIFVERPYITRAGSSEALVETLRGYQQDPATRRDSRLYPELQGKTIEPYEALGIPAATLVPAETEMQSAILAVRQAGITTGVRVEANNIEMARLIAEKALGRLP